MSQANWTDYANLSANVANLAVNSAQLESLSQVQGQIAQLAQIEANRERRQEFENNLRQFVFDEETKLEDMKVHFSANPGSLWVGANVIKHNLDSVPVTAASFQEFIDKDRVRNFNGEILAVIRECETQLSANQLNNTRLAFQYISERTALEQYIEMQKAIDFLSTTEEEYRGLETTKRKMVEKQGFGWLGIVVIVPLLIYGGMATLFSLVFDIPLPRELSRVLEIVALIAFFCWGIYWWRKIDRQGKPIDLQYENLQSMRAEMQRRIPPQGRQDQLIAQFGVDVTSEQLMQMRDDREAQILKLLRSP